MYYSRIVSLKTNYSLPFLFNSKTHQPNLYHLEYLLFKLRFSGSASTISFRSYSIQRFLNYLSSFEIEISTFVVSDDNDGLNDLVDRYSYSLLQSSSGKGITISSRNSHLLALKDFCIFLNKNYNRSINLQLLTRFISQNSKRKKKNKDIPSEYLETLVDIANPDSELNPFESSSDTRLRNFIIIMLLVETGMRIGELMSLTTRSYSEINQRFYISISDIAIAKDSRSSKGKIKTGSSYRTVSISKELFSLIHAYTIKSRPSLISKSNKLDADVGFLMISNKGAPLSKDSILLIISKLNSMANMITKSDLKITTHSFRYTFANNFLSYLIEVRGIEFEKAIDQLRVIMGWAINSSMPSKYAENYISKVANRENLKRLSTIYNEH